jgi:chromate transporter
VQLGNALRGRAGAWVAGCATVLPFFIVMTLFASFYQLPAVRSLASHPLLHHFTAVLAMLIAVTAFRQARTFIHGKMEWSIAVLAVVTLTFARTSAVYVALLAGAFAMGWFSAAKPAAPIRLATGLSNRERQRDWLLVTVLVVLTVMFSLPVAPHNEMSLLWPRLGGAGLALFGGGFSAVPVLKTLFVTPAIGISENDFMLAFALSPIAPGPLLNVVPFFGYLIGHWTGAICATFALFTPSACLAILAQRRLPVFRQHPRFEPAMRLLRAATIAFLAVAFAKIVARLPWEPAYGATALFALLCFARLNVPVYAVYGTVGTVFGIVTWYT